MAISSSSGTEFSQDKKMYAEDFDEESLPVSPIMVCTADKDLTKIFQAPLKPNDALPYVQLRMDVETRVGRMWEALTGGRDFSFGYEELEQPSSLTKGELQTCLLLQEPQHTGNVDCSWDNARIEI